MPKQQPGKKNIMNKLMFSIKYVDHEHTTGKPEQRKKQTPNKRLPTGEE